MKYHFNDYHYPDGMTLNVSSWLKEQSKRELQRRMAKQRMLKRVTLGFLAAGLGLVAWPLW
jgi:hypothetical protein